MMKFDYASDIHLDFWVKVDANLDKMEKVIHEFAQKLIPREPSDILIIAGDIGHYELQNHMLLTYLKETYKTIFYVFGNHDYYLVSNRMKKKFKTSLNKTKVMEENWKELGDVIRLDGQVVEREGIRFSGCDMWYDFSYGINQLGYTKEQVRADWWDMFNDAKNHVGLPDTLTHAAQEKEKASTVACDVFISHVPPIGIPVPNTYIEDLRYLSFYTFNGLDLFEKEKPKVWITGHMHQQFETELNGIIMLSNAIGYPDTRKSVPQPFKTFTL